MSSATIINVSGKKNNDVRGHAKEEYFKIPFPVIAIFFYLTLKFNGIWNGTLNSQLEQI